MEFYRRRLPHWQPAGKRLFLTWHLRGSLPHNRFAPPAKVTSGEAFVSMDRFLDAARFGPSWMRRDDVAQIVADAIQYAAGILSYYELHAYVVMANHVHLLVSPHVPASKLLQSVKGFSAREANKLLGRSGKAFWQSESYDHWIRNDAEFERVLRYIENNPVRAGLVARPEDYQWSSGYKNAGMNAVVAG